MSTTPPPATPPRKSHNRNMKCIHRRPEPYNVVHGNYQLDLSDESIERILADLIVGRQVDNRDNRGLAAT